MSDDYLWDRTGEPDPDVVQLEQVLAKLRWSKTQSAPNFATPLRRRHRMNLWMAVAALILLGIGTAVFVRQAHTARSLTSWQLSISGAKPQPMRAGQLVETTATARGTIQSESIGKVDIEPDSRLRLLASTPDQQRFALDRGTIHALIWAPPARFVVDTPAAKAVDLGCAYTLHVDPSGVGLLAVQMGWVAFESHGIESFIPAGAACRTTPGHGPDTPYFTDASPAFRNAIADFDLNGNRQALRLALAAARPRDGLTLWHLLQRTHADERAEVFDRFAAVVNMPPTVTRNAVLRGDKAAFDAAWNALDLGSTTWWREWKRQW